MPSKDQDGLAEIGEGRMFSEEMSRVYTDLMIGKEPLVGAERWDRYYATGGVAPPPLPPPSRSVRERFSPLQALANFELLHTAMREAASIGMSTEEMENAVSILANQTPRPTIRMIRFRKE